MFSSRIRFRRIQEEVSDDLSYDSIAIGPSSLLTSPSGSRSHSPSSLSPIPSSVVGYAARGMRRCNIRRLFTFAFFIFATTLLILSLPKENFGSKFLLIIAYDLIFTAFIEIQKVVPRSASPFEVEYIFSEISHNSSSHYIQQWQAERADRVIVFDQI